MIRAATKSRSAGYERVIRLVRRFGPTLLPVLLGCLAVVGRRVGLGPFYSTLASNVAIDAIALMGLVVLFGWSGQMSLGHSAFIGVGAYTTALLSPHIWEYDWAPLVSLACSMAACMVAGLVVALPAARLSRTHLLVLTLGAAQVFQWALNEFTGLSGGFQGRLMYSVQVGPWDFGDPDQRLVGCLVVAFLAGLVCEALRPTTAARAMLAIRDSELVATSSGINPAVPKTLAFVFSAGFAGVSGWALAYASLIVVPGNFQLFNNVFLFAAVIIGGATTLTAAWIGAVFLVAVPQVSANVSHGVFYPLITGFVLVAAVFARDIRGNLHRAQAVQVPDTGPRSASVAQVGAAPSDGADHG